MNEIKVPIFKPPMGCKPAIPCRRRRIMSSPYPPSLSHDFRLADVNLWPAVAAAPFLLLLCNPQLHYRSPLRRFTNGSKLPTVQRAAAADGTGSKTHVNREREEGTNKVDSWRSVDTIYVSMAMGRKVDYKSAEIWTNLGRFRR